MAAAKILLGVEVRLSSIGISRRTCGDIIDETGSITGRICQGGVFIVQSLGKISQMQCKYGFAYAAAAGDAAFLSGPVAPAKHDRYNRLRSGLHVCGQESRNKQHRYL